MIYPLVKNTLFLFPPETAHRISMNGLHAASSLPFLKHWIAHQFQYTSTRLKKTIMGLEFPNPVGLGAGFDKNAEHLDVLALLGFGFIEIGTVTPLAQAGNPAPRLFRLPDQKALINRMGFNNDGVEKIAARLKDRKSKEHAPLIIGGNIGKNKVTENEDAWRDYCINFKGLEEVVDYFVVNVSSPNTPNLRELQDKKPLMEILSRLIESRNEFIKKDFPHKPILLKIAPDLSNEQLDDVVSIVNETGIEGIVATNTTISRAGLNTDSSIVESIGAGGLSGRVLLGRSNEVIHYIHQKSEGKIPMIGVGGIFNEQDAIQKIESGAALVQVYTGFIYEGPALVKKIAKALRKKI